MDMKDVGILVKKIEIRRHDDTIEVKERKKELKDFLNKNKNKKGFLM